MQRQRSSKETKGSREKSPWVSKQGISWFDLNGILLFPQSSKVDIYENNSAMCNFILKTYMGIPWSNSEGYARPRFFLAPRFPMAGNCNILPKVGGCLGTDLRRFLHTVSFRFFYSTENQEMQLSLTAHWQRWVHSCWGAASSYLAAYCLTQLQPRSHRQRDGNVHATEKQWVSHLLPIQTHFSSLLPIAN